MTRKETILRFLEPGLKNPFLFIKTVSVQLIYSSYDIVNILIFRQIAIYAEAQGDHQMLIMAWGFLIFVIIFFIVKYIARHRGRGEAYYVFRTYILKKYMAKFFQLDNTSVNKYGTGRIIYIINSGADERVRSIMDSTSIIGDLTIKLLFFLLLIAYMDIWYAVIFVIAYSVMTYMVIKINKKANNSRDARRESDENVSKQLVKMIMSKQDVLQSGKTEEELIKIEEEHKKTTISNLVINQYLRLMFNIPLSIISLSVIMFLFYNVSTMRLGVFSFVDFVAITTMFGYLTSTMMWSVDMLRNLTKMFVFVKKFRNFFDDTPYMKGYEEGNEFVFKNGEVEFNKVNFSYDEKNKVVDDMSIKLKGGKKTALVGISGGGKSTIIKMIAGYIRPDKGNISIDGQNLSEVALKTYYKHIGYLTQEPNVFDGSIYENLVYALNYEPDDQQIQNAIKDSGCDFINEMPHGLETEIGEKGVRLSGGQRQRLAIARIFLKNPEILLLDEPTSALDSVSEEKISDALHKLFKGRTVIIIAHRLQTVKEADDIIVIDQGKIVERGTHKELSKLKGAYDKMLKLQTGF